MWLVIFITFTEELIELRVNIEKYTQRNISQNTGLHKYALIAIKLGSNILPSSTYVAIERKSNTIGVGNYSPITSSSLVSYKNIYVNSEEQITAALKSASAGTVINIAPGHYTFKGNYLYFAAKGAKNAPIILRADNIGDVTFNMQLREGLLIPSPYIIIENLVFLGGKTKYDTIEHALHIVGDADHIEIRHNEFINFNAHIKANSIKNKAGQRIYPDHVKILNNNFYNHWKRNTLSPASPIDVVGGKGWLVANNFIADFAKYGRKGRGVTYGVFLKGASEDGIIENNLVNCQWQVEHTSANDIRIGISLGNGGTGKKFCMDGQCAYEHKNGIIRNNTILNCQNDVAIYINKGKDTLIENNYIANSLGIDVRHVESNAIISQNYLDSRIKATKGATITTVNNAPLSNY